jgi:hypothetical protein
VLIRSAVLIRSGVLARSAAAVPGTPARRDPRATMTR